MVSQAIEATWRMWAQRLDEGDQQTLIGHIREKPVSKV